MAPYPMVPIVPMVRVLDALASRRALAVASALFLCLSFASAFSHAFAQVTTRVSVGLATPADLADGDSLDPAVSANGRYIAFRSVAMNLVPGDTNDHSDIFVRDTVTNTTQRVSVATDGTQANGDSFSPSISGDGRYVAFHSFAGNLVPGDTNNFADVFVRDTVNHTTTRVSLASGSGQANAGSFNPSISADGTHVAFHSDATNLVDQDANNQTDVFLRDLVNGTTTLVSVSTANIQGNVGSYVHSSPASLSTNGRYVLFQSLAGNLVTDDTNGRSDYFVRDTVAGTTTRVTVAWDGSQIIGDSLVASLSSDGRYVAFQSWADNVVPNDTNGKQDIFVRDIAGSATTRVSIAPGGAEADGPSSTPVISAGGRFVTFVSFAPNITGDTSSTEYVVLRDTQENTTTIVSQVPGGGKPNGNSEAPVLSADGSIVVFQSEASNLMPGDSNFASDIFVRDMSSSAFTRASTASVPGRLQGNHSSTFASVSADGRYVAFWSGASDLVENDTNGTDDIFLRDVANGTTNRVSVATDGAEGNESSLSPAISADGRFVAFRSGASNLVANDTNNVSDIFIHDTVNNTTERVSLATDGSQANSDSYAPRLSADGRYVAFQSTASNLVAGDTNNRPDIFVRDTVANTTTRVNVATDGTEANDTTYSPFAISADDRFVAFASDASNLVANDVNNRTDIFVRDTKENTTTRVSVASDGTEADSQSYVPAISADGHYVAFESSASNLVAGDTNYSSDIFVRDTMEHTTTRVSVAADGTDPDNGSNAPSISADGRYVAFDSRASNLVSGDTNFDLDVFVRDTVSHATTRVSIAADGTDPNYSSSHASISADGRYVAFESLASNLVAGDTNSLTDIYLRGPLFSSAPPFTAADMITVLRAAGGLSSPAAADVARLDVEKGASAGRLDVPDAIRLARKVAGTEANP